MGKGRDGSNLHSQKVTSSGWPDRFEFHVSYHGIWAASCDCYTFIKHVIKLMYTISGKNQLHKLFLTDFQEGLSFDHLPISSRHLQGEREGGNERERVR